MYRCYVCVVCVSISLAYLAESLSHTHTHMVYSHTHTHTVLQPGMPGRVSLTYTHMVYSHTHIQSYNLSVHVNLTSDVYFGDSSGLEQRLADFHGDINRFSSSLTFGWPHSQEQLSTFLGERYVKSIVILKIRYVFVSSYVGFS